MCLTTRYGAVWGTRLELGGAAAFGSQLAGLIVTRYWLQIEPIASMSIDDVVRYTAPGLRAAMRGPVRARGLA